jgi:hypothetical protein
VTRLPIPFLALASLMLSASLTGCNDTAYLPTGGSESDEDPNARMVMVYGIVTDSMLGGALPGVRVASGPYITEADLGGQWSLEVPEGIRSFTTSPAGYERVTETIEVRSMTYLNLMARRLAPVVQDCVRDGNYIHAFVSDLQGRKTVERWSRSEVLILDPAGDTRVGAINWGYEAVDYLTWKVTLGPVGPNANVVRWNVFDSENHQFVGACEPTDISGEQ